MPISMELDASSFVLDEFQFLSSEGITARETQEIGVDQPAATTVSSPTATDSQLREHCQ